MEKNKILWIVVAISLALCIFFGVAWLMFIPSRSTGPSLQQATSVSPSTTNQNKIDPDSWVRVPGTTPGLDSGAQPATGNINLTIVNGDNAGANYGTVDVTGLTKTPPPGTAGDKTSTLDIPGQTKTPADTAPQTSVSPSSAKAAPVKAAPVKAAPTTATPAAAVKSATVKSAPVKATAPKTVTVTDYWIQTGSFTGKLNAEKARDSLTARYLKAEIFTKEVAGKTTYRVRVGPYKTKTEADYWLGTVKEVPEFAGSYVSEVKTKK